MDSGQLSPGLGSACSTFVVLDLWQRSLGQGSAAPLRCQACAQVLSWSAGSKDRVAGRLPCAVDPAAVHLGKFFFFPNLHNRSLLKPRHSPASSMFANRGAAPRQPPLVQACLTAYEVFFGNQPCEHWGGWAPPTPPPCFEPCASLLDSL